MLIYSDFTQSDQFSAERLYHMHINEWQAQNETLEITSAATFPRLFECVRLNIDEQIYDLLLKNPLQAKMVQVHHSNNV